MIPCARMDCEDLATRGGLLVLQPNGMDASHAVYYACDEHPGILESAVETWPVTEELQ